MRAEIFVLALVLVLPTELTAITQSSNIKQDDPKSLPPVEAEMEAEISSSIEDQPTNGTNLGSGERQRRLIPYMTFYLTREYNRPHPHLQQDDPHQPQPPQQPSSGGSPSYHLVPNKVIVQPYHGKFIVTNYQPKYHDPPPILYQPKGGFTPFLESNKLPGGFTPIRSPGVNLNENLPGIKHLQVVAHPQSGVGLSVNGHTSGHNNLSPESFGPQSVKEQVINVQAINQEGINHQAVKAQLVNVQPISPESIPIKPQLIHSPNRSPQPIRVQVLHPQSSVSKEPDYSVIFDKLVQLKQLQEYGKQPQFPADHPPKVSVATQYYTRDFAPLNPPGKFVPVEHYPPDPASERYKPTEPVKTYIHTYTPSNIDIPSDNKVQTYENFESLKTYNQIPSPVSQIRHKDFPRPANAKLVPEEHLRPQIPEHLEDHQKNYETIIVRPVYHQPPVKTYRPIYEPQTPAPPVYPTENPHSLSVILKQLQDSNTLPQTLTPDNIDNSIKTLVQILNALKHTQKFQRPIVVTPRGQGGAGDEENVEDYDELPGTVTHTYPTHTPEGGTPGKPGIDYPAHSFIPQTNFNCKKQRYKGFFGDPDTNCQVWHYCDLNGGQASFLCPNGTIFSQVALTCDWWYNVKCASTTQLYVLNERLYKYILPFTPKFPEDYSGPLVDRYLALKFKEMEEKMKNQKKGKTEKPADDDVQESEANKLEDLENESVAETKELTTVSNQNVSE